LENQSIADVHKGSIDGWVVETVGVWNVTSEFL